MADVERVIMPGVTNWQHPNWFAYFPANNSYPSILGELMSAGLGVQGMSWVTSPACTELETLMLDWMQELLGLPDRFRSTSETGGGVIQGSASEATLVAILSARFRRPVGAVNIDGDTSKLVAYATSQAHSSIEKGLRIAGIGTDHLRVVRARRHLRDAPRCARRDDHRRPRGRARPVLRQLEPRHDVVDGVRPHREIGPICREHDVVAARRRGDGRHRRAGARVPLGQRRPRVRRLVLHEPAQVDGCQLRLHDLLDRDRASLLGALSILPEFLRSAAAESGAVIDYRDWQVPLGRRFRALKLWFTIRCEGVEAFQADDP